ncbi:TonB-dependent receptor plug domain-containing protein [Pseudodesulfovibrio sp. F-1]|uniref:TonB-dependent receptor plug domain-containing protein n=1 Tax=Pseudodesulfovibrio alkaliphilus TaxID=2661613 RepID=A0A7K1KQZ0_9BACT|nr:TonB-dependent receptor [Pseudodesulfovibrio alkaliphilus]MUM78504.1 TonB-dependent receptor plug domain-containing protein [Pseudodesulfovibrio alkaliphilus]
MKGIVRVMVVLLFAALSASFADAGDGEGRKRELVLEPVVVNAEKRAEESQDVPVSITVFERNDLLDMGIEGIGDLSEHVPNMEFHDFGSSRHGLLFLRGIKSLPTGQAGTGFTVDGVSYNKSHMFGFPLLNVDRVEVLRGAQGTLYGRNTTGGVVNVYTARPGNEVVSTAGVTLGNYGTRKLRADWSGPLIEEKLFLGVSGLAEVSEGFMKNDIDADGDDGRHTDGKAARVKLRLQATDNWDMTLSVDGQHHDDGAYSSRRTERNGYVMAGTYGVDSPYHYSHDFAGSQEVDFWGSSLNSDWTTDLGILSSITGYRSYDSDEWIDADFSPLDNMRKNYRQTDKALTQEFRMVSPEDSGSMRWLVGTYLFHFDSKTDVSNHLGAASASPGMEVRFNTKQKNDGAALFGEGTWELLPSLELTLGLRGEYEHAQGRSSRTNIPAGGPAAVVKSFDRQDDYAALLPKVSLAWHFAEDAMTYATVARAHKAGGFNDASAPADGESYSEEDSWLYEVGVKSLLLDKRLMLNVAAFHTRIRDEQLPLFQAATMQGYLASAGKSHRTGLELESRFKLAEEWTLSGSASWIDARFDEYEDASLGVDYAGKRVFCVPEYSFDVAVDYQKRFAGEWEMFGRAGVSGVGPQFFDNANEVRQAAYQLASLRLGFRRKGLECSLWAKNLFDRHYVVFENTTAGVAEDGRPRTFGLSVDYTF